MDYDRFDSQECEKSKQEFKKNKPSASPSLDPECPKLFSFSEDWNQLLRTKNVLKIHPETKNYFVKIHQSLLEHLEGKLFVWFDEKGEELEKTVLTIRQNPTEYEGEHVYFESLLSNLGISIGVSISRQNTP